MLQSERLRNAARVNKEAAMESYNAGRLGGAKDKAYVASFFFPELPGLRRLNAVLQVLIGYEKKINGSVDWYAVLGAYPNEDVPTIQKRYRKLFLDMTVDDGESLDGTYRANKILSDSWKFLCNKKGKKLYDERRCYELRLRDQLRSPLVETPKEEAVNGVVGSKRNVASHDDETMKNLGTESTKEAQVKKD